MAEAEHKHGFFGWAAGAIAWIVENKIEAVLIGGVAIGGLILLTKAAKGTASSTSAAQNANNATLAALMAGIPTTAELQASVANNQIGTAGNVATTNSNNALQAALAQTSAGVTAAQLQAALGTVESNNTVTMNSSNNATQLGIVQSNNQTSSSITALNDASQVQALQIQANAILGATGMQNQINNLNEQLLQKQSALNTVGNLINQPAYQGTNTTAAFDKYVQQANSVLAQAGTLLNPAPPGVA